MNIIEKFYTAFRQKDFGTMQSCYHPEAIFTDEVFVNLNAAQVKAMWEMLIKSAKDMELIFKNVQVNGNTASANWIATYTFSLTGRKVINDIQASFELKDGLIYRHRDRFNFYTWAKMAFGSKGVLLGWLPFFRKKLQQVTREKLEGFMSKLKA